MDEPGVILAEDPTAIVTVDIDGRIVQSNPSAEHRMGVAPGSARGQALDELVVPPDLRALYWSSLLGIASGRIPLDEPVHMRTRLLGGERETDTEVTVACTGRDPLRVTAYVSDGAGDRSERDRNRRVLDTCAELTRTAGWEVDLDTRRVIHMPGVLRLLGIAGREGDGPLRSDEIPFTSEEDRDRFAALQVELFAHPERYLDELSRVSTRLALPDGTTRTVLTSWQTRADAHGRPRWLVGAVQDVTAMRSTEQEVEALHAVSEAMAEWEDATGTVELLGELGSALGADVAGMWAEHDTPDELWCRWFWHRPGFDAADMEAACRRVPLTAGIGITGNAFATREPATGVPAPETPYGPGTISAGIRTVVAFPALYENEPLAVFAVGYEYTREIDASMLRTFETIGRAVGPFLHDRRGELGRQPLSQRELQVLRLAAEGQTGPEIARRLTLSPATVKTHFNNLYAKLGVADRAAAVAQAFRLGLLG